MLQAQLCLPDVSGSWRLIFRSTLIREHSGSLDADYFLASGYPTI
jgi:hypothetical protein